MFQRIRGYCHKWAFIEFNDLSPSRSLVSSPKAKSKRQAGTRIFPSPGTVRYHCDTSGTSMVRRLRARAAPFCI